MDMAPFGLQLLIPADPDLADTIYQPSHGHKYSMPNATSLVKLNGFMGHDSITLSEVSHFRAT